MNYTRRDCLKQMAVGTFAAACGTMPTRTLCGQEPGERPQHTAQAQDGVTVINPGGRVPLSIIVDDSTCLVNLNRFAMPQFDAAFGGTNPAYQRNWQQWPAEIPDDFVRKFADWANGHGVRGKYSIVPYPACVGRVDRLLPGWSQQALRASLDLVRQRMMPAWDIHPEMVTHTRVIDLATGHPYAANTRDYMENWDWTTGKSVDEMTAYLAYALQILKDAGLECEGVTTPGGFGTRARPQLAAGVLESCRSVFQTEIPHYFRDLYDGGTKSVMPRVELASGLDGEDPRCVVSIVGCTGDWTGGWDCSLPVGADAFISPDLRSGRMIDVIERGEPAIMVCHWTGIYFNGEELGLQVFDQVVRRLHQRYSHLKWMKLSEIARYWAARELTAIDKVDGIVSLHAPFACPGFTMKVAGWEDMPPQFESGVATVTFRTVTDPLQLTSGTCCRQGNAWLVCFDLPRGASRLV
ncbi:MAG: hypothetical protein KDB23_05435 [Planctomycetales bacterium]|nr:hypothetical protein [Planctomycetales bacterium]